MSDNLKGGCAVLSFFMLTGGLAAGGFEGVLVGFCTFLVLMAIFLFILILTTFKNHL